jgi:hypothetical protein
VVHKNASDEENDLDNGVHAYFASIEIECLSNKKRNKRSMINVKIGKQNVRMKADTGAEATVIPYHLYQKITRKPLQKIDQPLKGWLATKPIHPRGCVRLPTEYEGRKLDLLYLVVEGDFTPLLGCDACLQRIQANIGWQCIFLVLPLRLDVRIMHLNVPQTIMKLNSGTKPQIL